MKAIMFDFDDVMALDKTGTESICNYISKNTGIEKSIFEAEYRKYNGELLYGKTTHENIWDELCLGMGISIPIKILYDSFIHTKIDSDMYNLVKELKRSNYVTALITDNKVDRIRMIEKHFGINEYFDIITISAEIGSDKNKEKIFLKTLEKLQAEPKESIFIDNQEQNLVIPQKIGIKTIFYNDKDRKIHDLRGKLSEYGVKIQ
jgi:putative hydrolase of the HAD superfamily